MPKTLRHFVKTKHNLSEFYPICIFSSGIGSHVQSAYLAVKKFIKIEDFHIENERGKIWVFRKKSYKRVKTDIV